MHPLTDFRQLFPDHRLIETPGELRYLFQGTDCAKIYERVAQRMIVKNKFPLQTMIDIWISGGVVREIALVVREAPEQDIVERTCGDEVQDTEELEYGGGWGYQGREE